MIKDSYRRIFNESSAEDIAAHKAAKANWNMYSDKSWNTKMLAIVP